MLAKNPFEDPLLSRKSPKLANQGNFNLKLLHIHPRKGNLKLDKSIKERNGFESETNILFCKIKPKESFPLSIHCFNDQIQDHKLSISLNSTLKTSATHKSHHYLPKMKKYKNKRNF